MYLSQLILNPRSRDARTDLADRYELHRTLLNAFPETLPENERVLYRVEDNRNLPIVSVLVQSQFLPDWDAAERMQRRGYLADAPQVRCIMPEIAQGKRLPFRLQANPTVKRDGSRHAIYGDEDLHTWLQRKGEQH
ncbi:MAG: type I-E CRISPR-associated protein Cas6/Cse3/CasE, partial [Anaerolineae bacterium]|nr:type I-E CRISPR-associated protein Cas6/Cse3/CasE [Anaerolineae bacterium]